MRTLVLLLVPFTAHAQSIEMPWTARLLDASGSPRQGDVSVEVRLYNVEVDGEAVWSDTFQTTAEEGFVTLNLGSGEHPLDLGDFQGDAWIETWIDNQQVAARQSLVHVPYAAVAESIRLAGPRDEGACTGQAGAVVYDTDLGGIRVCDGTAWQFAETEALSTTLPAPFRRYQRVDISAPSVRVYANAPSFGSWGGINPDYMLAPESPEHTGRVSYLNASGDHQFTRTFRDTTNSEDLRPKAITADDDYTYFLTRSASAQNVWVIVCASHDGATVEWAQRLDTGFDLYQGIIEVDDQYLYVMGGPNGRNQTFARFDKSDGSLAAAVQSPDYQGTLNGIAVMDGHAYVLTEDSVLAFDPAATLIWHYSHNNTDITFNNGVATDGESVWYVGGKTNGQSAHVIAFDPLTGAERSQNYYELPSSYSLATEGNAGHKLVVTADRTLLAIMKWNYQPMMLAVDLDTMQGAFWRAPANGTRVHTVKGAFSDHEGDVVIYTSRTPEAGGSSQLGVMTFNENTIGSSPFRLVNSPSAQSGSTPPGVTNYTFNPFGGAPTSVTVTPSVASAPTLLSTSW